MAGGVRYEWWRAKPPAIVAQPSHKRVIPQFPGSVAAASRLPNRPQPAAIVKPWLQPDKPPAPTDLAAGSGIPSGTGKAFHSWFRPRLAPPKRKRR